MAVNPLIDVEDLNKLLEEKDEKVKLIQATFNQEGKEEFLKGHIPESRLFDVRECSDPDSDIPYMLPPAELFAKYVGSLGINNSSRVIVYDSTAKPVVSAARVWWMFRVFGHDDVQVLNGGFQAWREKSLETESGEARGTVESAEFKGEFKKLLYASAEDVEAFLAAKNGKLLDARPLSMANEVGTITGAVNAFFMNVYDSGVWKGAEAMRNMFEKFGANVEEDMIVFCKIGVSSCTLALAAFICGNANVAVYDGSYTEWNKRASEQK